MAHPLRIAILGSLRVDGPATSAMLARRLDTDSGQTSHHLRQLARFGFVVEAPELGRGARGRERWWRAGHDATIVDDVDELGPAGVDAYRALEGAARRVRDQMIDQYGAQAARREWSAGWRKSAGSNDFAIRTTPEGLAALRADIERVINKHDQGEAAAPDAESVIVVVHAFPRRPQR